MNGSDLAVVVVRLPKKQVVRFQGILAGEDGLATLRCRDEGNIEQQLWTTRAQLGELYAWLRGLPAELGIEIVREEA